ncbi:DUF805 domain-containing protein [Persicobacter psychrovividus]|uniref:DUF805 domain-containing protein n=1 Tax=Persicobacter psychrovividus TaxID=387638 RepID=A0ABN6L464_9BACT|nr:hypothetical protein PEPS_01100 [Persicobacter psychrovividus]
MFNAIFKGQCNRKNYWSFLLLNIAIVILGNIIVKSVLHDISKIIYVIAYELLVLIPLLFVSYRRVKDTGKKGLYWFIAPILLFFPSAEK